MSGPIWPEPMTATFWMVRPACVKLMGRRKVSRPWPQPKAWLQALHLGDGRRRRQIPHSRGLARKRLGTVGRANPMALDPRPRPAAAAILAQVGRARGSTLSMLRDEEPPPPCTLFESGHQ